MNESQKSGFVWVAVIGLIGVAVWWFNYSDHSEKKKWEQIKGAADAVRGGRQPVRRNEVIVNGHRGHYEYLDNPAGYSAGGLKPHSEFVDDDLNQQVITDPDGGQSVATPPD